MEKHRQHFVHAFEAQTSLWLIGDIMISSFAFGYLKWKATGASRYRI